MDCVICSVALQPSLSPVFDPQTREVFSILRCERCGLGQTIPQPQDLSPYYTNYHGNRHGFTARLCLRRRFNWVNQVSQGKTGKLLDIGCGDGSFLRLAAERGWEVAGTELDPGAASAVGLQVSRELRDLKSEAPFDCITLWHSLEHLENPAAVLREANELLAPQGHILIAVPNADGWQARLFGTKWFHRDVPRHLFHFGPSSLRALLHAEGFDLLRSRHQEFEYDLLGWSQSMLNCISSTPNVFFQLLTTRPLTMPPLLRLLHLAGGLLFSSLALPLLPITAAFRAGGTLMVVARKQ